MNRPALRFSSVLVATREGQREVRAIAVAGAPGLLATENPRLPGSWGITHAASGRRLVPIVDGFEDPQVAPWACAVATVLAFAPLADWTLGLGELAADIDRRGLRFWDHAPPGWLPERLVEARRAS
jgi:hypothetical protein